MKTYEEYMTYFPMTDGKEICTFLDELNEDSEKSEEKE